MCGIIGQVSVGVPIEAAEFDQMRDSLAHRGPDGFGTVLLEDGRVALGHRRLSIIDLSDKGKQPMTNEDETVWITYNGEIYNFKELRTSLIEAGHVFRSDSDTEVIVHGYEEWGGGVFSKLKGMFALGIYDVKQHKLILSRDRFGIKPLYYYWDGEAFIFASELKAIVRSERFKKLIDWSSVLDFFVYRFVPTPKSIWKNVNKLSPACYLEFDVKEFSFRKKSYWSLIGDNRNDSLEFLTARFDQLMRNSIEEHLVSDVPVGVLLSSGYDSTAVAHYMNRLGYPIKSFTIGFQDWHKSEHEYARQIAGIFSSDHTEKILADDNVDIVGKLAYYYDEPQGGSSFIPTFEVCALAKEKVKVVMSGDGGDELLAGYSWHKRIMNLYDGGIRGFLARWSIPNFLENAYHNCLSWTKLSYSEANLLFNNVLDQKDLPDILWLYSEKAVKGDDPLKRLQRLDISTFMLDVFLPKVDRASMANSIEVRVPFLDHELMEYVFSLSSKCYYREGVNKVVLNNLLKKVLPDDILNKPKKGFGYPLNRPRELEMISSGVSGGRLVREGIVNSRLVNSYIEQKDTSKLWALYVFESWFQNWC